MMKLLTIFSGLSLICSAHFALAQNSPEGSQQNAYECTQLSIEKVDESLLTKAERLALMDQNLRTSMDQYDQCVSAVQQQQAGGGGGSGGGGRGGGNGDGGNSEGTGEGQSSSQTQSQQNSTEQDSATSQQASTSQQTARSTSTTNAPRGVVKPKDNDSIICQLLWEEIQSAPPDKIDGFKKQYEDYKCG
ncbi:MAG: hypothetical protein AAGJ37_06240 [Pseudomonadota bacterium]